MIELLAGIILGITAHQAERITRRMPDGWQQMTNYGIGWLAVYPLFGFVFKRITGSAYDRARIAYILSGVFFGVGVGIGRVIDAMLRGRR